MKEKSIQHPKLLAVAAAAAITLPAAGSVILANDQIQSDSIITTETCASSNEQSMDSKSSNIEREQNDNLENNTSKDPDSLLPPASNPEVINPDGKASEIQQESFSGYDPEQGDKSKKDESNGSNTSQVSFDVVETSQLAQKDPVTVIIPEQLYETNKTDQAELQVSMGQMKNEQGISDYGTILSIRSDYGEVELPIYRSGFCKWEELEDSSLYQMIYYPSGTNQPIFKFNNSEEGRQIYSVGLKIVDNILSVWLDSFNFTEGNSYEFKLPNSGKSYIAPYTVDELGFLTFEKDGFIYQIQNGKTDVDGEVSVEPSKNLQAESLTVKSSVTYNGKNYL